MNDLNQQTRTKAVSKLIAPGENTFELAAIKRVLYYWGHKDALNKTPKEVEKITGFRFEPRGQIVYGDLTKIAKMTGFELMTISAALKEMKSDRILATRTSGRDFVSNLPIDSKEAQVRKVLYYWGHPKALETPVSEVKRITGFNFKPQGKLNRGDMGKIAELTGVKITYLSKHKVIMEKEGLL